MTIQNGIYVEGLIENLQMVLDKWIINGSKNTRISIYNLLKQIEREAMDEELVLRAKVTKCIVCV